MARATKTDPELWEQVKAEVTRGSKGGAPGQWSARKAQMAVRAYKRRGGGYADSGAGQAATDLHKWTEEDWGTRSGRRSGDTGERYLPKKVRMLLTDDEYARSTMNKRRDTQRGGHQFSDQPADVREKVRVIKSQGPTREMLLERARELGIGGRSEMPKDRLLRAIERATDREGRARESGPMAALTHDELYRRAQSAGIRGRSSMRKRELIEALAACAADGRRQ